MAPRTVHELLSNLPKGARQLIEEQMNNPEPMALLKFHWNRIMLLPYADAVRILEHMANAQMVAEETWSSAVKGHIDYVPGEYIAPEILRLDGAQVRVAKMHHLITAALREEEFAENQKENQSF